MEEHPVEAMETDSVDALDDIMETAHILADAMDSSNSKPDSESTGKSETVSQLAAVKEIEEKTKQEPLTKEPEGAEKNEEIDPKVAEAVVEIENGDEPKEKAIENSETQPAKESPKTLSQDLTEAAMDTTPIQSKPDSLEGVREEPEAGKIDKTIDSPKEEKEVVAEDEKVEESVETDIDPAPLVQDVETGELTPKQETANIQPRLNSESNDLSEADLTEVPMEIEPPHISEKPPSPLPPPPVQIPDDLKSESIAKPLEINADTTDKSIVPPVPIDEIQPQSPRIIELLDDDDEEMSLPTKTLHATKRQASHESANKLPACKKDSKSNSPVNLPVVVVENNNDDDDDTKHIYYEKDCVNYECKRQNKRFVKVPLFILNFYKIPRKTNKTQFVCDDCYDRAVEKYEDLAASLQAQLPLLEQDIPKRQDFVEILDSSDEDDEKDSGKMKDEPEFEKETINMLQKELDDTICDILSRVEIKSQVNWSKSILKNKLKKLEADSLEITNSLKKLQKSADKMHTSLYQCPKIKIKELQPLDLNTGRPFISETEYTIPPLGELKFAPIVVNAIYYAVRNKAIASWLPCRVIELMDVVISGQKAVKYYKVKYVRIKIPTIKCVSAKHMAYGDPPSVRLSIGARVIALFDGSTLSRSKESVARSAFYPGIVAEQLQAYNKYRYLVFFDDGYAQYVHHKDVRVVCQAAENVWEDVHPASREFIHNYLSQYQKHRPMVQVKKGQSMITESNGKWLYAKVVDIDASLVQMHFDGQNRSEWIYRGSTRLGPLFREKQTNRNVPISQLPRRSEPYVRYMQDDDTANRNDVVPALATDKQAGRAVAKKSTTKQDTQTSPAVPVKHLNNSTIFLEDDNRPKGKVVYYTAKKNMPPKLFITHQCSPDCLFTITHNLSSYSPLAKPLLSGWERQIFKSKLKKSVVYRGPCGRRIRNMEELHKYLRLTKNILNVDNFDFDCVIHCLAEYVIESSIVQMPDLSVGLENMIIPCINYYDNTMPPECEYSAERIPTEGVNLNLDPSFLVGCDCEDDCSDKSKCSCWQLTLSGARFGNPNTPPENVGYSYKRLPDPVPTGIYECNLNCKCSKSCLNRVVQHPLQMKLQVFKTSNRGWGLRCLNDVPKGSFICIYAGHLLTEQKANEGGANAGDEYFAELDYIEVVERLKEGYESDVQEDNESEDEEYEEPNPDADSDEDFRSSASINKNASINTRLRARKSTRDYSEDEKGTKANAENGEEEEDSDKHDQERQVISFVPNTSLGNEESTSATKYRSIRKYFGKNEFCYIMDAKTTGNIGRYFNHSCSPNLFVQNVFVDTQDLRFPWVAFFALSHIRAGTELTWNYNYEVGIVPGKVLYCECGAPNCRGRLL